MAKSKKEQLFTILKESNKPLPSSFLSAKLNVTERSIRNYVKELNHILQATIIVSSQQSEQLFMSLPIMGIGLTLIPNKIGRASCRERVSSPV